MAQQLIIYLEHLLPNAALKWGQLNQAGNALLKEGELTISELAQKFHKQQVIILLPAAKVSLMTATVPTKNINTVRQGVPNVLEEQLAQPIDELFFAIERKKDFEYKVAVVDKSYLAAALDFVQQHNIYPQACYSAIHALALTDGKATLVELADNQQLIMRCNQDFGFAASNASLALYLEQLTSADKKLPLNLYLRQQESLAQYQQLHLDITAYNYSSLMQLFATGVAKNAGLNLLQQQFKIKKRSAFWGKYRLSLALMAVLALFLLTNFGYQTYLKQRAIKSNEQRIAAIFKQLFPNTRLVNVKAQLGDRINRLAQQGAKNNDFLPLLDAALNAFAFDNSAEVLKILYRDHALELELKVADNKSLENIRKRIDSTAYLAQIVSSELKNKQVIGRIRIE